jgi:hypothetical protein
MINKLMNQTRKQIIELIEPYMDKTFTKEVICRYMVQVWENEFIDMLENYYNVASCEPYEEVVWHYDITAVLKYLEDNIKDMTWQEFDKNKIDFIYWFKENEEWEPLFVDVREIIFTQEFMKKYVSYCEYNWIIAPSKYKEFLIDLFKNLNNPVDYLYTLINNIKEYER